MGECPPAGWEVGRDHLPPQGGDLSLELALCFLLAFLSCRRTGNTLPSEAGKSLTLRWQGQLSQGAALASVLTALVRMPDRRPPFC